MRSSIKVSVGRIVIMLAYTCNHQRPTTLKENYINLILNRSTFLQFVSPTKQSEQIYGSVLLHLRQRAMN